MKYEHIGKRKALDNWRWYTPKMLESADFISNSSAGPIVAFDASNTTSKAKNESAGACQESSGRCVSRSGSDTRYVQSPYNSIK
jgi:hypothetical protein